MEFLGDYHLTTDAEEVGWRVEVLDRRVERELDALTEDVRQRFLRIVELIEKYGVAAIYLTATGERVVVVHAFVKKTRKTPPRALEIARARAKEVG